MMVQHSGRAKAMLMLVLAAMLVPFASWETGDPDDEVYDATYGADDGDDGDDFPLEDDEVPDEDDEEDLDDDFDPEEGDEDDEPAEVEDDELDEFEDSRDLVPVMYGADD